MEWGMSEEFSEGAEAIFFKGMESYDDIPLVKTYPLLYFVKTFSSETELFVDCIQTV